MFSSLHFRLWRRIPNPHVGQQPISGCPNEPEGITAWTPLIVALPHQPGSGLSEKWETRRLLEWLGINIVDLWPPGKRPDQRWKNPHMGPLPHNDLYR